MRCWRVRVKGSGDTDRQATRHKHGRQQQTAADGQRNRPWMQWTAPFAVSRQRSVASAASRNQQSKRPGPSPIPAPRSVIFVRIALRPRRHSGRLMLSNAVYFPAGPCANSGPWRRRRIRPKQGSRDQPAACAILTTAFLGPALKKASVPHASVANTRRLSNLGVPCCSCSCSRSRSCSSSCPARLLDAVVLCCSLHPRHPRQESCPRTPVCALPQAAPSALINPTSLPLPLLALGPLHPGHRKRAYQRPASKGPTSATSPWPRRSDLPRAVSPC